MPAVPPTPGSVSAIERALSSICLNASGVEKSGFGAPCLMAMPMPTRPRSQRPVRTPSFCSFARSDLALQGADRAEEVVHRLAGFLGEAFCSRLHHLPDRQGAENFHG